MVNHTNGRTKRQCRDMLAWFLKPLEIPACLAARPSAASHSATLQSECCLAVAGSADEAKRVLAPALRTCAALGLSRLLIDERPQVLRLTMENAVADERARPHLPRMGLSLCPHRGLCHRTRRHAVTSSE